LFLQPLNKTSQTVQQLKTGIFDAPNPFKAVQTFIPNRSYFNRKTAIQSHIPDILEAITTPGTPDQLQSGK
jgi:hypothetical protein